MKPVYSQPFKCNYPVLLSLFCLSENHIPCYTQKGSVEYTLPSTRVWGCSSVGRAPRSQRGGQRFDPAQLHHTFNHFQHCIGRPAPRPTQHATLIRSWPARCPRNTTVDSHLRRNRSSNGRRAKLRLQSLASICGANNSLSAWCDKLRPPTLSSLSGEHPSPHRSLCAIRGGQTIADFQSPIGPVQFLLRPVRRWLRQAGVQGRYASMAAGISTSFTSSHLVAFSALPLFFLRSSSRSFTSESRVTFLEAPGPIVSWPLHLCLSSGDRPSNFLSFRLPCLSPLLEHSLSPPRHPHLPLRHPRRPPSRRLSVSAPT
jgi:hypothetical protein